MTTRKLESKKKIAFNDIPNETTKKALRLAAAKDEGIIPDYSPSFNNLDDLMKSLDK